MYYMVFGFEISSTGYHHYQGYVELRKEMKYTDLYPIIGAKCYFAVRRGSKIQAINYALKDLNGIEFGTLTAQGQRVDIEQVRIDIENGKSQKDIAKKILVNGVVIIRLLLYMLQWLKKHEARQCEIEVIYGPPGTGKSTLAMTRYPHAYRKSLDHQYWDGYQNQEEIIIDEFRKGMLPANVLLSLVSPAPYSIKY